MLHHYHLTKTGKRKCLQPNAKQKTFLRSIPCNEQGIDWNGRGYANRERLYNLTPYQMKKYKSLSDYIPPKKKSEEEKKETWCKRLIKLTSVSSDEALDIAEAKIKFHYDKINDLIDRGQGISRSRDKLIESLIRSNPLRRIKDIDHAHAILIAHNRHTKSNYEDKLEEGRTLVQEGQIEDAKEFARKNFSYW